MLKYKSLFALNISVYFLMLGVGLIVTLLPQKIILLSNSLSKVGYLASAFAVPYVLVQLPVGRLSDIFGFKKFIISGYALCAITGFVYFYCETSDSLLIGRMIQGMGEAPVWALAPAFLSVMYPSDKGRYMGFYNASIHAGLMSGSILSIFLYKIWKGNEPFILFAVLSASGAIILFLFLDNISSKQSAEKKNIFDKKLISLVRNVDNSIILFGITLYGVGYGIFITCIPAYLISIKNYTQTEISIFFSIFYVAISISQIIAGPLSDRKGCLPIMCSGLLMTVVGLSSFIMFINPLFINLLLFISSIGLGVFCISSMTFLNKNVSPELTGTVSGAFYLFWGIGYFFGPMIINNSDSVVNFEVKIIILSCVIISEAFFIFILTRKNDKYNFAEIN